jgi:hypothetical protein
MQDFAVICQGFSNIDFKDEVFWSIIEKKFTQELNDSPQDVKTLATISFALDNCNGIS